MMALFYMQESLNCATFFVSVELPVAARPSPAANPVVKPAPGTLLLP